MTNRFRQGRLWHRSFALLFASRAVKDLADGFASIAFVWLLVESGGNALGTSILFFCSVVPQMLLSSFVSPLLTKGRLQQWMFASDGFRALAILLVPVCHLLGALPLWLFFVSAVLQSAIGSLYPPASVALLPRVVAQEQLQQANALLQSSSQVITIIGLAGAGVVIQLFSAPVTLMVTAALFLLSALLILLVRTGHVNRRDAAPAEKESYLAQVKQGFSIVRRHPLLFGLNLFAVCLNVGGAPFLALAPIYVTEHLNGDASTLTMLRAGVAIGALGMGLLLTRVKIRRHGALFTYAGIAGGLSTMAMGLTEQLPLVLFACLVSGMAVSAINVPEMVIVQTVVPPRQQAQVFSVLMTFSFALLPPAILLSGQLASWLGAAEVILLGGTVTVISGIGVLLFTPLVRMRTGAQEQGAYQG
ncbi:MFS transporter [Brevibacillus sp. SYP-B805]|uniref:MFS transporter n=1 Tax=Brevibacillus sp. SYP-B805 TaxID=1578199 RepID=UPI0013EA4F29|nr:MFS transporter [Brevibacillus sp. SYP-B805]NGQ94203.1 MFS transporter [Brevibacillus sp. SYP-B805]